MTNKRIARGLLINKGDKKREHHCGGGGANTASSHLLRRRKKATSFSREKKEGLGLGKKMKRFLSENVVKGGKTFNLKKKERRARGVIPFSSITQEKRKVTGKRVVNHRAFLQPKLIGERGFLIWGGGEKGGQREMFCFTKS